jgi:hypothetical protein
MALQSSQSVTTTAVAPTPITPTASDTIAQSSFGAEGVWIRVITTGTTTTVAMLDPGTTASGNPGTVTGQAMPATGTRQWLIPLAAVNPATGVATVTFSGALTGVTYELWRA